MPDKTEFVTLPCDLTGPQRVLLPHMDRRDKYATVTKLRRKLNLTSNLREKELVIGTWNVRGLNQPGKVENILREMERLHCNVLGLAETFWKGKKDFNSSLPNGKEYKVFASGGNKSRKGVAIIIEKRLANNVIQLDTRSDRVMGMILRAKPKDFLVIQGYAPTSTESDEEIEGFYEEVEKCIKELGGKKDRVLCIMGDWNAKIGTNRISEVMGPFGLGTRNERGERCISFCEKHDLIIANSYFEQKENARHTWVSPCGNYRNQIDYIMVNRRYRNGVRKAKVMPSADCGSDHRLILAYLKLKLKKTTKTSKKVKWNLSNLRNEENRKKYQEHISKNLTVNESKKEQPNWESFKNSIKGAAKVAVKEQQVIKRKPWITEEIIDLMDERRKVKNKTTSKEKEEYKNLNKRIRNKCRQEKNNWLLNKCSEIERLDKENRSRELHTKLKELNPKNKSQNITAIKDKNGNYIIETNEKNERWRQYLWELYDDNRPIKPQIDENEETPGILEEEVRRAIKNLPDNKASGCDDIPAELIKNCGEEGIKYLTEIIKNIYEEGVLPEDFTKTICIPIPKTKNATECENHRTIALISHASKILLRIIKNRIYPKISSCVSEQQNGFVNGKGTINAIWELRTILERTIEMNKTIYVCFIDFQKAFDQVQHDQLIEILKEIDIDKKDLKIITELYWNQEMVLINDESGSKISVFKGIRQGCIISPTLFNIYSEYLMREIEMMEIGIIINGVCFNNIRYADDTALMTDNKKDLEELISVIDRKGKKCGLNLNMKKTKFMRIDKNNSRTRKEKIYGGLIEQVTSFNYLGSTISDDARIINEVQNRIIKAKAAFWNNKFILRNDINLNIKKKIIKTYVWSVVNYGCETWTFNKQIIKKLDAFEMWCYRRALKISWTERINNREILRRMGTEKELVNNMIKRKMKFAGHILRGSGGQNTLIALEGKIEGKRSRGRRRRQWMDDVCQWSEGRSYVETKR